MRRDWQSYEYIKEYSRENINYPLNYLIQMIFWMGVMILCTQIQKKIKELKSKKNYVQNLAEDI